MRLETNKYKLHILKKMNNKFIIVDTMIGVLTVQDVKSVINLEMNSSRIHRNRQRKSCIGVIVMKLTMMNISVYFINSKPSM